MTVEEFLKHQCECMIQVPLTLILVTLQSMFIASSSRHQFQEIRQHSASLVAQLKQEYREGVNGVKLMMTSNAIRKS